MPSRACGFCIYNDVALAIARARAAGLRVLYVDLDVHHGDGVEAIHAADPDVLTVSIHESGRYLFPGTGFAGEIGEGAAAGTVVNVPLEPDTGEAAGSTPSRRSSRSSPRRSGPTSSSASTAATPTPRTRSRTSRSRRRDGRGGAAGRRCSPTEYAGGRWLATGGGGYDVYRVVPRSWSLVWLAGAHRDVPRDAAGVARAMGRGGGPATGAPSAGDVRRRSCRRRSSRRPMRCPGAREPSVRETAWCRG